MPLLKINAGPKGPCLHRSADCPDRALAQALRTPGPIIIMVHGYKFAPGHPKACPHGHILSLSPRRNWKALSWPLGLGLGAGAQNEGVAIAFGWDARGTLWRAYASASDAGRRLAALVEKIHSRAPHRPVQMIAHSLGARVVLGALAHLPAGSIGRVILLNGADYAETAQHALAAPAGERAEVINVTTRENDVFDFLFERLIRPPHHGARCLAEGFPVLPNTLNIQLDHPDARVALSRLGFDTAQETTRICHWSSYLRPGLLEVYRALLREPERMPIHRLRETLPDTADPRWSRLWPRTISCNSPRVDPGAQAWLSSSGSTSSTMNQ